MSDSWKLTLPCTRAEAEAIDVDMATLAALDPPPVLMTSEAVLDDPDKWRLDAYFDEEPDGPTIAAIRALVPSAGRRHVKLERLADENWIELSQAGLEPVRAGRFFVHTSSFKGTPPADARTFLIEAGLAFGTGQHETTTGCMLTLDAMKRRGTLVRNLLDMGTGTGLLAFAAMHLWPGAFATASDIDPSAVIVTQENAVVNQVLQGTGRGRLAIAEAAGLEHELLIARAPYDLIIANILAGPLVDLAPTIAAALAPGGTVVLAGLLNTQQGRVVAAFRARGLRLAGVAQRGDWPTLRLVKRARYAPSRASA